MLSLDDARERLRQAAQVLPTITRDLSGTRGLRLVDPPRADVSQPPTAVSAMDGYAARAEDLARERPLPVAFEVPAGAAPQALEAGQCARIFTGGAVPEGADTVVPQEQAEVQEDGRVLLEPLQLGKHIRRAGEVFDAGTPLASVGEAITPQRIALLAAGGASKLAVVPRPRVALIMTGSELVPVSASPRPGQIRNSNGPMCRALVEEAGLEVSFEAQVADRMEELQQTLRRAAAEADLVMTCGGVSVGDYDLVPQALDALGGETIFHGVLMKPGKPLLAGHFDDSYLLGLPGNPVSALVGWRLFGRPLCELLAGDGTAFEEEPQRVILEEDVANPRKRSLLRPVRVRYEEGRLRALLLPWKGSHDLYTVASASGLVRLEPGQAVDMGGEVDYYPLPWRW